jgi:hypothetical protein
LAHASCVLQSRAEQPPDASQEEKEEPSLFGLTVVNRLDTALHITVLHHLLAWGTFVSSLVGRAIFRPQTNGSSSSFEVLYRGYLFFWR